MKSSSEESSCSGQDSTPMVIGNVRNGNLVLKWMASALRTIATLFSRATTCYAIFGSTKRTGLPPTTSSLLKRILLTIQSSRMIIRKIRQSFKISKETPFNEWEGNRYMLMGLYQWWS